MNDNKTSKPLLVFSAIDKYIEKNKIENTESEARGQNFIEWGDANSYPTFLNDVYQNSPTLKAIIQSVIDYALGNIAESTEIILSPEKLEDLLSSMVYSYAVYGGFALNILRNRLGAIADIVPMDMRNVRCNKDNTVFYYSEYFGKRSYGRCKTVAYEKYDQNKKEQYSSIFYYKNTRFQTYPTPVWSAAVNAAMIESKVSDYHLNNLANGFSSNVMVSLNNGTPSDDVQEEIEENFNEKFCGSGNAGRVVLAFSPDKEHAPEIHTFDTEDFGDKYNSLVKYAKDTLFASFRCNPNLIGIATESNGFNSEEYQSSFKLFNRTVIKPIQKVICNSFDKIFGKQGVVTIKPFTLEGDEESEVK